MAGPDVVADLDALVADDADALAERAPLADRDDRVAAQSRPATACPRSCSRADRSRCPRRSRCAPRRRSPWAGSRSSPRRRSRANFRARRCRGPIAPNRAAAAPRGLDHVARHPPDLVLQHGGTVQRDAVAVPVARPWPTAWSRSGSVSSTTSRRATACSPTSLRLGLDEVAATGRLDREFEFVEEQRAGLPSGSEHDIKRAFAKLDDEGVVADHRTVDLRQRADRRAAVRRGPHPRDQLLGRRAHPLAVDVPLPGRLARGGAAGARGADGRARLAPRRGRVRPVAGRAPLRRVLRVGAGRLGLEVTGTASISSLAETADDILTRLRAGNPDVLVYLGLGVSSRAVALARADARLGRARCSRTPRSMFGYARRDWRDGYAGWEYVDTIADDNQRRAVAARALTPRGRRPDRLRGLRHGASARRSGRAVRSSRPAPASPTACAA